jgi:hypothetical protein
MCDEGRRAVISRENTIDEICMRESKTPGVKQSPEHSFINTKLGQSHSDFFSGKRWRWRKVRLRHFALVHCRVNGRCANGWDSEFLNFQFPISCIVLIRRTILAREMDGQAPNRRIESWTGLSSNAPPHNSEFIEMGNLAFQIHGRLRARATPSSTMTVFYPSIVAVELIPTNPFAFDTRRCKISE